MKMNVTPLAATRAAVYVRVSTAGGKQRMTCPFLTRRRRPRYYAAFLRDPDGNEIDVVTFSAD